MLEQDIQKEIQLAISRLNIGTSFRINVGIGWTGNKVTKNSNGSITIMNPRPFATFGSQTKNLKGFSDLLVVVPAIITQDMVGEQFARACFIEVKSPTGKPSPEQVKFLRNMAGIGALAGVARSFEDVLKIINGS